MHKYPAFTLFSFPSSRSSNHRTQIVQLDPEVEQDGSFFTPPDDGHSSAYRSCDRYSTPFLSAYSAFEPGSMFSYTTSDFDRDQGGSLRNEFIDELFDDSINGGDEEPSEGTLDEERIDGSEMMPCPHNPSNPPEASHERENVLLARIEDILQQQHQIVERMESLFRKQLQQQPTMLPHMIPNSSFFSSPFSFVPLRSQDHSFHPNQNQTHTQPIIELDEGDEETDNQETNNQDRSRHNPDLAEASGQLPPTTQESIQARSDETLNHAFPKSTRSQDDVFADLIEELNHFF